MKMKILPISILAILSLQSLAAENTTLVEQEKQWELTSEVGAIVTSGNTETTTLKGALKAKHNLESWRNEYKLDGIFSEGESENEDGVKEKETTSRKYEISLQGNYELNEENSHLFIYGSYTKDHFGAYRSEAVFSVGYGLRLLNTQNMYLDVQLGPGIKQFEYAESAIDEKTGLSLAGETDSEAIGLAKLDYQWQVSENARFTQLVGIEYGSTNTKTISESALLTKIHGSLQMKVAYNITHNSDVDEDKEKTDTETSLTLVYNF
ncbi:DUF481 domain-containing protein [Pseudoalteromonas umbrosa]|uniref:DUF481 domain-containing protein n=1 Tax=Pseudoalteromonas umbrosa TaxID=3048489 RepID=UPI0024C34B99|nr:DUF481 domain-containing protein [Pseudoalteromonas sp. B95]MDK1289592.1 DUF481 domain-containing protein [Pseudoalteromonas sp. B95]